MAIEYLQNDKTARLALAYGTVNIHSGNGKIIRRKVETVGSSQIVYLQLALGVAPIHAVTKATYDLFDIPLTNVILHNDGDDPEDEYFPSDVDHPGASWANIRLPEGFSAEGDADKVVIQVEAREIADYNSSGVQTDFGFSKSPARILADAAKLLTGSISILEMGALDEFKAFCAETISVVKDGVTISIPRFELGLFFIPSFSFKTILDRITQLTCSDWQWRNGKIRIIPPVDRVSAYTFDLSKVTQDFQFRALKKSERPNGVVVNYRDADDPFLEDAEPVIIKRDALIAADDDIESFFEINGGVCNKFQAERLANYWAKIKCDLLDFAMNISGHPDSYKTLPGDSAALSHTTPDWENKRVKIVRKYEKEDRQTNSAGVEIFDAYRFDFQLEPENPYSDSDHTPLVTREPVERINPFAAPPIPTLILTEETPFQSNDGTIERAIKGTVTFGDFGFRQIVKIYWTRPGKSPELYIELTPDINNEATFRVKNLPTGTNYFKAIAYSNLGIANLTAGGEETANAVSFDFVANGRINGLDAFGAYRGRDTAVVTLSAITAKIDSVSISGNDTDVLLGITINGLGEDEDDNPIHNNSDSVNAIQVDVYNQFGELVKSFSPSAANPIGGQFVCKFPRKYADPESGQCYFKIQVKNYFGYSSPIYLQGTTRTTTVPTPKVRDDCPLEATGVPFSSSAIRCFYQFTGDVNLWRRKPGESSWITHASDIDESPYLADGLGEYSEYEFQFVASANTANRSNIFREFTKQQGEAVPDRPTPTAISGGPNAADPQTKLDFSCISSANVETEVYVDGALADTLSAVAPGGTISFQITGLSASNSRSVKFRHKWGSGDYSLFTEEITRSTNAATPTELAPVIDFAEYDALNQQVIADFTPRGGSGNFQVERKIGSGSWTTIIPSLSSGATGFTDAYEQNRFERFLYYRIKRITTAISEPYSTPYEVRVPPSDDPYLLL